MAAYKYPRHVWLVDELPKGPTGKILRREVKPPADVLRELVTGAGGRTARPGTSPTSPTPRAALDLLLSDAALGVMRRFRPDGSTLRLGLNLARRPWTVARRSAALAGELGRIAAGRSADRSRAARPAVRRPGVDWATRCSGGSCRPTWRAAHAAEALLADAELGWRDGERVGFVVHNLVDAAAPEQQPAAEPGRVEGAHRHRRAERGARGPRVRCPTWPPPRGSRPWSRPTRSRSAAIWPSRPGAVVRAGGDLRADPVPAGHADACTEFPLVIVPPMINKFYVTDLAPGRSMSSTWWRRATRCSWSPGATRTPGTGTGALDAYGQAIVDALDAARAIAGAAKASIFALCSGGIVSSMVAAHLADTGRPGAARASLYLGVTVLDQVQAGTAAALADEHARGAGRRGLHGPAATWTAGRWPRCSPGCGPTT